MEGFVFVGAVLIAIGALFCFFGYAIFKIILALTGFFLGGIMTAAMLGGASDGDVLLMIIGFLGGGVIGAVLLVLLYIIGVFLIGMGLGIGISYSILTLMGLAENDFSVLLALFLGIFSGVLALIIQRILIILSTAFNGSGMMVTGMAMITTVWDLDVDRLADDPDRQLDIISDEAGIAFFIIWLALGIVGAVFQFFYTGRRASRQRPYPPGYAGPPAAYPQQPYYPPAPQPYQQANYGQPYGQPPYPQQVSPYQQSGYPGQAPPPYQPPVQTQQVPPYQPPPPAQSPSSSGYQAPGYPQPPTQPPAAPPAPPAMPQQSPMPPPWEERPGEGSTPGRDQPG